MSCRGELNLADPRWGAEVLYATDDFFGAKERLIEPREPVFIPDRFDDHGKWMDGWESRRRRDSGFDHCVVWLGRAARIHAVEIDTRHFTGNNPPAASLDACLAEDRDGWNRARWSSLLPVQPLSGNNQHFFTTTAAEPVTHVRLNILPDGGVARLRVFGSIDLDSLPRDSEGLVDLAAAACGGRALIANDEHFGKLANIIAPGRAANMGEGWETRRRREPGCDWGILALATPGVVERVLVDTTHFKGNFPDRISIQAALLPDMSHSTDAAHLRIAARSLFWGTLLAEQALSADTERVFDRELKKISAVSHVCINIFPDGGLSRIRLLGRPRV